MKVEAKYNIEEIKCTRCNHPNKVTLPHYSFIPTDDDGRVNKLKEEIKQLREENEHLKTYDNLEIERIVQYIELYSQSFKEIDKLKAENKELNRNIEEKSLRLINRERDLNETLKKLDDTRVEENMLRKGLSERIKENNELKSNNERLERDKLMAMYQHLEEMNALQSIIDNNEVGYDILHSKYEQLKSQLQQKFDVGIDFAKCNKSHTSEDVINCFACLPKWYRESEKRNEALRKASAAIAKPESKPICERDMCESSKNYHATIRWLFNSNN